MKTIKGCNQKITENRKNNEETWKKYQTTLHTHYYFEVLLWSFINFYFFD